jgi:hypothetical protein
VADQDEARHFGAEDKLLGVAVGSWASTVPPEERLIEDLEVSEYEED